MGLIPVLTLGPILGMRVASLQRDAVVLAHEALAHSVEKDVEAFLAEPGTALAQIAHAATKEGLREVFAAAFADHIRSVEVVYLIDAKGMVVLAEAAPGIAVHPDDLVGTDRSRDPLFSAASASDGEPVWSAVFTSPVTGRRSIAVAAPFEQGVAQADVHIESLASAVRPALSDARTTVVITDREGTVLFHSSPEVAALRPNYRSIPPIIAGLRGRTGDYEYVLDGTRMLGSTALIDGAGWVVLVQQDRASALRPVATVWWSIGVLIFFVAVAATLGALIYADELSRPVAELVTLAQAVERGDYTGKAPDLGVKELARLARTLSGMSDAVQMRERELRASREELAKAVEEREAALVRVSAMSAELAATEERERRALAEELHDRVSQVLAVAKMRLGIAREGECLNDSDVAEASRLIGEALSQTRAITSELSPPALYELGVSAALSDLTLYFGEQHGMQVHVEMQGEEPPLSEDTRAALYRSARELLMNAVRHSGVQEAWVDLDFRPDAIRLTVRDEGAGVREDGVEPEGGFGLFSIRERLLHLGGSLEIQTAPGEGFCATVTIPL